jgi:hypothetical protein
MELEYVLKINQFDKPWERWFSDPDISFKPLLRSMFVVGRNKRISYLTTMSVSFSHSWNNSPIRSVYYIAPAYIFNASSSNCIHSVKLGTDYVALFNLVFREAHLRALARILGVENDSGLWYDKSVGIATIWTVRGSISGRDMRLFSSVASGPALGHTQPPIQWASGSLLLGVKLPECEADHSPASSTEVENGGTIPPLRSTSSWHGA